MTNRLRVFISLGLGAAWCPICLSQPQVSSTPSQLEFFVIDRFGNRISQAEIALEDESTHAVRNFTLPPATAVEIPRGSYSVRVWARSYETSDFRLQVDRPRLFVPVELAIGTIIPTKPASSLLIRTHTQSSGPSFLWAKLVELYSGKGVNIRADADGNIRVAALQPGRYVCLLFDGGELRSTQLLSLQHGANTVMLQ